MFIFAKLSQAPARPYYHYSRRPVQSSPVRHPEQFQNRLLGYQGRSSSVEDHYLTKKGQLANQLATSQSPGYAVASYYNIAIMAISQVFLVIKNTVGLSNQGNQKSYLTKLATSQSPRNSVASYNIAILVISQLFQIEL